MSIYLRNLKKYFRNITPFSPIVLLISLLVASVLFYKLAFGHYQARYTESAHGIYANRSTVSGYSIGNCAHCHEMHASIGGDSNTAYDFALFAPNNPISQTHNFCFQCHGPNSVQVGGVTNNDYGCEFGGGTAMFTTIYDAFNPTGSNASSHNLNDVRTFAINVIQADYTNKDNACIVCHDPHYAQKNHDPYTAQKTAIIRPDQHTAYPRNLWGDEYQTEEGWQETLKAWTALYQAPKRADSGYEPVTGSLGDGSDLPNFVRFCAESCHRLSVNGLEAINWMKTQGGYWPGCPSKHGEKTATGGNNWGDKKYPYDKPDNYNYVLSCTDCHEPHGSTNPFLLRTYVNGKGPITVEPGRTGGWTFYEFCTACHENLLEKNHGGLSFKTNMDCYQAEACHAHGADGGCAGGGL